MFHLRTKRFLPAFDAQGHTIYCTPSPYRFAYFHDILLIGMALKLNHNYVHNIAVCYANLG